MQRQSKRAASVQRRNKPVQKVTKKKLATINKSKKTSLTPSFKQAPLHTATKRHSSFFSTPCAPDAPVLTEIVDENILVIKWNKPSRLNAMDVEMGNRFLEISKALKEDNCKTIKAVIFTGNGRAFSAGGDLQFLKDRSEDVPQNNIEKMIAFYSRFMSVRELPQITISAINGPAVGAGACISLLTDFRIMSSAASIGFSFVNLGLHPGMGATHYLPKLTNPQISNHLLLAGEIIDAGSAKNYQIIHDVVQVDQPDDIELNNKLTLDSAVILAKHYTKHHSLATYTLTRTLRAQQDVGLDSALLREAECQALTYNSAEFKQRLDAMMNRKKKQ